MLENKTTLSNRISAIPPVFRDRERNGSYFLQPPPLLLLLLYALLSLCEQLTFVLLLLPELLLLEELLATECLRSLLVLLLQADEVAAQRRLAGHVDNGAEWWGDAGRKRLYW